AQRAPLGTQELRKPARLREGLRRVRHSLPDQRLHDVLVPHQILRAPREWQAPRHERSPRACRLLRPRTGRADGRRVRARVRGGARGARAGSRGEARARSAKHLGAPRRAHSRPRPACPRRKEPGAGPGTGMTAARSVDPARQAGVLVIGTTLATVAAALTPLLVVRLIGKGDVARLLSVTLVYETLAMLLST